MHNRLRPALLFHFLSAFYADSLVADDHGTAQRAIGHIRKEQKAEEEYEGVFVGQRFVLRVVIGASQREEQTGVHRQDGAPGTLASVADGVEFAVLDVQGDGRNDEDDACRCRDDRTDLKI